MCGGSDTGRREQRGQIVDMVLETGPAMREGRSEEKEERKESAQRLLLRFLLGRVGGKKSVLARRLAQNAWTGLCDGIRAWAGFWQGACELRGLARRCY